MSEAVSIGELEALRAKMTPGEYGIEVPYGRQSTCHIIALGVACQVAIDVETRNADGLVAEHNAFPALAAAVKAALRYIELIDTQGKLTPEHLTDVFAAKDELRAALRKVRL